MINSFSGRYHFLSNFYPCNIEHQGIVYPSVEHYYVAMKFTDEQLIDGKYYTCSDLRELISKMENPGAVKRFGRKLKLRKDWDNKKLDIMKYGIDEKFKDPSLADLLKSTGDQELVEGNYWNDTFWGVCDGKGHNHLGKLLMNKRDQLNEKGLDSIFNKFK